MSLAHRKSLEPWLFDTVEYYPHQLEGIRKMLTLNSVILADDMGLGKSLQGLTVFAADVCRTTPDQVWATSAIVVCPASLLGNWWDEIQKFTRFPAMILGQEIDEHDQLKKLSPRQREAQLDRFAEMPNPKILIINYELLIKHIDRLNEMNFSHRFADEAHLLKNPSAGRTKAWHKLKAHRSFPMTGTPMLNNVDELWSLLHTVQPFEWPKYWTFKNRYCVFGGYKNKQIIGVKNEKELMERLHKVMIRRMKKDVLDLPEVQIIQHKVDLHDEQRKIYGEIANDLKLKRVDAENDEEIENALVKFLRLKQVCGTTLPFSGVDHSAKLDAVVEDVLNTSNNGHKCVVFTQFRDVLTQFAERLDKASPNTKIYEMTGETPKPDRTQMVKDWSGPNEKIVNASGTIELGNVIVCMLQVGGVGLNMTAGRHGFFIDKLFTPGMNQQAIDRMHRIGASETQQVQIHEYMCRGTIETRVEQILRTKSNLFGVIVNESDFKKKLIQALQEEEDDAA